MFKFIAVLFAFIACAAAKPGLLAPLSYSAPLVAAGPSPLAYSAPLAYAAAAYANAPLDAAYSSSRVDIKQNYNAAFLPTTFAGVAAPSKLVAPLTYAAAAPVGPFAPVAAPLKYTAAAPVLL